MFDASVSGCSLVEMNTLLGIVADAVYWIDARFVLEDLDTFTLVTLLVTVTSDHVELSSFVLARECAIE